MPTHHKATQILHIEYLNGALHMDQELREDLCNKIKQPKESMLCEEDCWTEDGWLAYPLWSGPDSGERYPELLIALQSMDGTADLILTWDNWRRTGLRVENYNVTKYTVARHFVMPEEPTGPIEAS